MTQTTNDSGWRIEVHAGVPPSVGDAVDDGLHAANLAAAPLDDVARLSCAALHGDAIVGGAVGRTWGVCCELQQLWVDERWRRRGIASALVRAFEARARERACTTFYLETFSFQAPALYAKLGYAVAARIEGFPDGIVKFVMVRNADTMADD